jgi:hypothetical protein
MAARTKRRTAVVGMLEGAAAAAPHPDGADALRGSVARHPGFDYTTATTAVVPAHGDFGSMPEVAEEEDASIRQSFAIKAASVVAALRERRTGAANAGRQAGQELEASFLDSSENSHVSVL